MTIKTKLSLGLGFLFLIIFTLAGFCSYYVGKSAQEAQNILKDNYNSLVYSRNMIAGLDEMVNTVTSTIFNPIDSGARSNYYATLFESGRSLFEANLKAENNNITEINEKEYVDRLTHDYETYLKLCLQIKKAKNGRSLYFNDFLPACEKLKKTINSIYDLNMQAVIRKSQLAKKDSDNFKTTMAGIGAVCFLLGLGYFWYFPFYISNTFRYLADRMRNLLTKMGVAFDIKTKDEAFVLLNAITLLENKFGVKNPDETLP